MLIDRVDRTPLCTMLAGGDPEGQRLSCTEKSLTLAQGWTLTIGMVTRSIIKEVILKKKLEVKTATAIVGQTIP